MAVSQGKYESCSLDLSPYPDKAKFGLREIWEGSGSDSDTSYSVSVISEDQKAAVEDIGQDPSSGEWRLVTRRGIRGQGFRRRSLDMCAREDYDVFFQDQDNKLIYLQDVDKKIISPYYRKYLKREILEEER